MTNKQDAAIERVARALESVPGNEWDDDQLKFAAARAIDALFNRWKPTEGRTMTWEEYAAFRNKHLDKVLKENIEELAVLTDSLEVKPKKYTFNSTDDNAIDGGAHG